MTSDKSNTTTELHITSRTGGAAKTITLSGDIAGLHDDPAKIHQLLDLLALPKGTEVKVLTQAAHVIVR